MHDTGVGIMNAFLVQMGDVDLVLGALLEMLSQLEQSMKCCTESSQQGAMHFKPLKKRRKQTCRYMWCGMAGGCGR